jgi:hypothetical protein
MKLIIFAVLIFVVSYIPFTAALHLLKNMLEGRDNPLHHSLITMTIATMWEYRALSALLQSRLCRPGKPSYVCIACLHALPALHQLRTQVDADYLREESGGRAGKAMLQLQLAQLRQSHGPLPHPHLHQLQQNLLHRQSAVSSFPKSTSTP